MSLSSLKYSLPLIFCVVAFSCKKESDPESDEVTQITYPRTLHFVKIAPDGEPLLYSNQQKVDDSVSAKLFNQAAFTFLQTFATAKSVTFFSEDTVAFAFKPSSGIGTSKFGVHRNGRSLTLVAEFGFTPQHQDTVMTDVVFDNNTGLAHRVYAASGDINELTVTAFAYRLCQYEIYNQMVWPLREESSMSAYRFKTSYINSLTSLDTLGIQPYAITYK